MLPLLLISVGFVIVVKYPGLFARAMRKEPSPGYLHVCRDAVLVQSDNGAWAALPTSFSRVMSRSPAKPTPETVWTIPMPLLAR